MDFPVIEYSKHPAFSKYLNKIKYNEQVLMNHIESIDYLYQNHLRQQKPTFDDIDSVLREMKNDCEKILFSTEESGISLIAKEWLGEVMQWTLDSFRYDFICKVHSARNYENKSIKGPHQEQLNDLRDKGLFIASLDESLYSEIKNQALCFLPELKQRLNENPGRRSVHTVMVKSKLGQAINRALSDKHVIDVVSEFKQTKMIFSGAGLEYSHSRQTWYKNLYTDEGVKNWPLQYLHIDESEWCPKAIIYITPVDENNGATRLVPESNKWPRSEFLFSVYKGLDRLLTDRYIPYWSGDEYRIAFRNKNLRRIFMELPTLFQGSSHFGDDILDDTFLAEELGSKEIQFVSTASEAIVFDGPRTLHRGSLVKEGERLALQIIFRNENDTKIRSIMEYGPGLGKRLRGFANVTRNMFWR